MASATPSIHDSAERKSLLNTASLFKAVPAQMREASGGAAAGAGNSEQNLPRFADALKLARRHATPERERPAIPQRRDEASERPASDVGEERQADARDVKAEKPPPRKEVAHDSARRSEKSRGRRDHDDAATQTHSEDADGDSQAAGEASASDDDSTTTDDTKPEETTEAPETPATQPSATDVAAAASQQIASPQSPGVQVPVAPKAADQPVTDEAEAEAPAAQPVVAQQNQPQQATPSQAKTKAASKAAGQAKPVEDSNAAKADAKPETKPATVAEKKPAKPVEPVDADETAEDLPRMAPQLARTRPLVQGQQSEHAEHAGDTPKKPDTGSAPAAELLQAMASADAAAPQVHHDAAPEPEPVKPAGDAQGVVTAAPAPAPAKTQPSAEAAGAAQEPPAPDADQTFEQVVMGLRGKLDARSGKAEIRLEPPNLGPLQVSLHLNNGSLTAQFQSSSDVVRDLLKSNMEKLKSVLEGQGIAVDKLAVGTVESSPDKAVTQPSKLPNSGAPNNDGRSAGQYHREPNNQKRPSGNAFGKIWRDANAEATSPVDLVG
jgi:flagellar hook-length control protein FliK